MHTQFSVFTNDVKYSNNHVYLLHSVEVNDKRVYYSSYTMQILFGSLFVNNVM